jgi:hypothetical protein
MAGYGYGAFGGNALATVHKGMFSLFFSINLCPFRCRFGVYEQETEISRNPYTGAISVVRENEFIPMGRGGYGYGAGYGYRYY